MHLFIYEGKEHRNAFHLKYYSKYVFLNYGCTELLKTQSILDFWLTCFKNAIQIQMPGKNQQQNSENFL